MRIRIVTVLGSVRPGNYTGKALALVNDELGKRPDVEVARVDLAAVDLPFPGRPATDVSTAKFRDAVREATGVVFATPEYHGSFSGVLKLAIENLGFPSVLATKPVALLGVAAGQIGAIKSLEHLRSVCSHVGAIVMPNFVSVAKVRQAFDEAGRCLDANVEKAVRSVAGTLMNYIDGAVCPAIALEAMIRGGEAA